MSDTYSYLGGICFEGEHNVNSVQQYWLRFCGKSSREAAIETYAKITLNTCKILCSKVRDGICSKVMYNWQTKACHISSGHCISGDDAIDFKNVTCNNSAPHLELYHRKRQPKGEFKLFIKVHNKKTNKLLYL